MGPTVKLIAYTAKPFDVAVASAKTCYSPRVVLPEEVNDGLRERIGASIWESGHHTPFQHATFTFGLENVSRHLVWSFLHAHPYYNSDQNSQRYVTLTEAKAHRPASLDAFPQLGRAYDDAVAAAWNAYADLAGALKGKSAKLLAGIGKVKGLSQKQLDSEAEKKAIEAARYVLPIAAYTSLYHTVSGLTLMRYARMASECDCPTEAALLVSRMLDEVAKVDPAWQKFVAVTPALPLSASHPGYDAAAAFAEEFDAELDGRNTKLVSFDENGEDLVASGVREALGKTRAALPDDDAIGLAVNPEKSDVLAGTLNCSPHSPILRALNLASYSFKTRLSHVTDSQNQRHRTTPAVRPLLSATHSREPDFVAPKIISSDSGLNTAFLEAMRVSWEAKNALAEGGVAHQDAAYILPNATAVRITETGRLIDWMHKWRMRTCFTAQEEIGGLALEQLSQASQVHPRLLKYAGPPCFFRKGAVREGSPCPEGPRWCGIDVWRAFPNVKRPF